MACVGAETGAQPLATVISRLEVRGHQYSLDVYGGVIATLADRHDINVIEDLQDKVIGSGTISNLMAGQLQFYEMQQAGKLFLVKLCLKIILYDAFSHFFCSYFSFRFVSSDRRLR